MSTLSDKYYTKEELIGIARENNIAENYFDDFIKFIENDIQQMSDENELSKDELGRAAVDFALVYFKIFDEQLKKGHGKDWAAVYANEYDMEGQQRAFYESYLAVKAIDSLLALEELKIHCRSVSADELYTKHFIFLMENSEALNNPDKQAALYSKIYKEQLAQGRSSLFAHNYADQMAGGEYIEISCFAFAAEYEKAINEGHSERYAGAYAEKMSEYVAGFASYEEALESDCFEFKKEELEEKYKYLK